MPPGPSLAEVGKKEETDSPSSSIGAEEDSSFSSSLSSSSDDEDGQVQSKLDNGALGSMDSLQDSLPIKRGLSRWFSGKSKSFASLSEAASLSSIKEMAKEENPFNKRRRVLLSCKGSWQRRASYAASLCALREEGSEQGDEEEDEEDEEERRPFHRKVIGGAFRSPRSFSLSDLHRAELA